MRKRLISVIVFVTMLSVLTLSACNSKDKSSEPPNDNASSTGKATTKPSSSAAVPRFEDLVFPDVLPTSYKMGTGNDYSYDDLTKKYDVSFLISNYGSAGNPDKDVIRKYLEEKFNLSIKMETVAADMEAVLATKMAGGTPPDVFWSYTDSIGKDLLKQGLLVDARTIYPYMPQTCQFVTKGMIEWSKADGTDELPFITKYGIQDGVWGFAIRKDWLEKFGMKQPASRDELMAYAKACVQNDPDGNGKADTYFMIGAGGGKGLGMLGEFFNMFGNNAARAEDGKLVHPLFDGTVQKTLQFLNELYTAGVLAPDWFTIEWEKAKAYTMNDKIGMVHYPAGALYAEYLGAQNNDYGKIPNWEFLQQAPVEGGKYSPAGNPGYCWAFSKQGFAEEGKLKRVAHMLDTMVMGGENFFETIQSGTKEVFEKFGYKPDDRVWKYNENGTYYYYNDPSSKFWTDAGSASTDFACLGPWQEFGLNVSWQRSAPNAPDPKIAEYNKIVNEASDAILKLDRWPNDGLISAVPAASIAPELGDFEIAAQYEFIVGKRAFANFEAYQKEWLNRGGRDVIKAICTKLGCDVPDYAK